MSTARFCHLFDMPERTWRRWQAKARAGGQPKGPWPRPARQSAKEVTLKHALAHPVWGHRKVWAMVGHDGHVVSEATVLRLLRDEGLILPAHYQRERRKLAERRRAAFAAEPTGPNQVWQLDFSEFETTTGGTWRLAGCRDYWSKYEHPFHLSPTANQHDTIDAIELALADYEAMFGHRWSRTARSTSTPANCCPWSRSSPTTAARSAPSDSRRSSSCTPSWPTSGPG
jgi:transposase InsO family protein